MKKICIIHYNTPRLTECLVLSINKYMSDAHIYIFDNSDKEPFVASFDNVTLLDNTQGQIIDFNKWLENYPNRHTSTGNVNNWGSAKHSYSVEKCIEIIDDNFILLDSDVLLKKDISELYDDKVLCISDVEKFARHNTMRCTPFICFINVKMMKSKGLHYFNDDYMYGLGKSTSSEYYDTGGYLYVLSQKYPSKRIQNKDYIVHYRAASWLDDAKSKHHYAPPISVENFIAKHSKLWQPRPKGNKKVVYTCISGKYDILRDPKYDNLDFDYICFTDQPFKSDIWQIRPIPQELMSLSQVKRQRYMKIMPHKYLGEYDFSIWIDGNTDIKSDLNTYIGDNCKKKDGCIIIGKHPVRNCIYDEMKACAAIHKDKMGIMKPQIDRYRKEGFPSHYGLPQSCIIMRYHNEEECHKVMETWWNEVKNGSHRDQLSFSYACWKHEDVKIHYVSKTIYNSQWFKWNAVHQSPKASAVKPSSAVKKKPVPVQKPTVNKSSKQLKTVKRNGPRIKSYQNTIF